MRGTETGSYNLPASSPDIAHLTPDVAGGNRVGQELRAVIILGALVVLRSQGGGMEH